MKIINDIQLNTDSGKISVLELNLSAVFAEPILDFWGPSAKLCRGSKMLNFLNYSFREVSLSKQHELKKESVIQKRKKITKTIGQIQQKNNNNNKINNLAYNPTQKLIKVIKYINN